MRCLIVVLLLLMAVPWTVSAQGDSRSEFVIEDPIGDVKAEVLGAGQTPTPDLVGTPATDNADLVSLALEDEDHETITIRLTLADISSLARTMDAQDILNYGVKFQVEGSPVTYVVRWSVLGLEYNGALPQGDGPRPISSSMCITTADSSCVTQHAVTYLDIETNSFLIEVPKLSLLGMNPREQAANLPGVPDSLDKGTKIVNWEAYSDKRGLATIFANILVWLSDYIGPAEEEYTLAYPAANSMIALRPPVEENSAPPLPYAVNCYPASACTEAPDEYAVGVAPGQATRVPITIQSRVESKRLVNLEAGVEGTATGWSVEVAPSIEVPADGTRKVSVLVNTSETLKHKDSAIILVKATSIGYEEEVGVLRILAQVSAPPSPDDPNLRFHMASPPDGYCVDPTGQLGCAYAYRTWLNTLEDDPEGTLDAEPYQDGGYNWGSDGSTLFQLAFGLDTPLVAPLEFDTTKPLVAELAFSAPRAVSAELQVTLGVARGDECNSGYCYEYTAIASAAKQIDISATEAHSVNLMLDPEFETFSPELGRPMVMVTVRSADPAATFSLVDDIAFHATESRLVLPLVESAKSAAGPSPIGLYPTGDVEEFVNPGKTKAFNVLVVNEGSTDDRVELTATTDPETWKANFRPAAKYRLAPGESVNVTLLVSAPDDAKEGDRVVIDVVAKSLNASGESSLVLAAIATTGIEIEDEAEATGDEEAAARALAEEGGDSPGLGMVTVLLAGLAGAASAARRRRA